MRSLAKGEHADIAHAERGWLRDIAALRADTMYRGGGYGQHPPSAALHELQETKPARPIESIVTIETTQRLSLSICDSPIGSDRGGSSCPQVEQLMKTPAQY